MPEPGQVVSSKLLGMKSKSSLYIWYQCPQCNEYRWLRISCMKIRDFTGLCKKCHCKRQLPPDALNKGPTHGSWKGGRHYRSGKQGDYIEVWLPPDDFFFPMARKIKGYGGYVYEHRLVMAQHLKRCLLSWEVVHHKNSIKDDNRLENLELLKSSARHISYSILEREIKKQAKEIRLLKSQIKILTSRLNQAIIPISESLNKGASND